MTRELKILILRKEYEKKLQEEVERPLIVAITFFQIFQNWHKKFINPQFFSTFGTVV